MMIKDLSEEQYEVLRDCFLRLKGKLQMSVFGEDHVRGSVITLGDIQLCRAGNKRWIEVKGR